MRSDMRSQFSDQEELWEAISVNISFCRGGNEKKAEKNVLTSHGPVGIRPQLSDYFFFFCSFPVGGTGVIK